MSFNESKITQSNDSEFFKGYTYTCVRKFSEIFNCYSVADELNKNKNDDCFYRCIILLL